MENNNKEQYAETQGENQEDIFTSLTIRFFEKARSIFKSNPNSSSVKLPSVKKLILDSFLIYKIRFRVLVGVIIITSLISLIPIMFSFVFIGGSIFLTSIAMAANKSIPMIIAIVIFMLISFFIQTWIQASTITAIAYYRENLGIIGSLKLGFKKIIPLIWLNILSGFITTGIAFISFTPLIIYYAASFILKNSPSPLLIILLTFPVFGAIIYIAIKLFSASYILIYENVGGLNAISRSMGYTGSRFWSIFKKFILLIIIAAGVIGGISFIINYLRVLTNISLINLVSYIPINFIIVPILTICAFLLYDNLRTGYSPQIQKTSNRGLLYLIIIGIAGSLLLIAGVAFALIQLNTSAKTLKKYKSSTNTQNEKVFTSPDKAWSIEYDTDKVYIENPSERFAGTTKKCTISFAVDSVRNPNLSSISEYIASNSAYFGQINGEYTVDGIEGIRTQYKNFNTSPNVIISSVSSQLQLNQTTDYIIIPVKDTLIIFQQTTNQNNNYCLEDTKEIYRMYRTFSLKTD